MTTPNPRDIVTAMTEARDLLDRLAGATRSDRSAFLFGYVLAYDAMAPQLPADEQIRHYNRANALQLLCAQDFR